MPNLMDSVLMILAIIPHGLPSKTIERNGWYQYTNNKGIGVFYQGWCRGY